MLKAAFKTELIQADSPLLSHSSSTLIRRGNRSQFVKTQLALWADWNHFSIQQNATDRSFEGWQQTANSSMVYQPWRTKGLSAQEWKCPPDVINRCIINLILCLGATDWLHACVTLSNPRVSIRKKPWNIFLGMVSDACHEIFIIWEQSHNRGGGSMRGFDLQKLRRLNHADRFLPSAVVTHKFTFTSVFLDEWHKAICHYCLLTYRYKLIKLKRRTALLRTCILHFICLADYNVVNIDWIQSFVS